MSAVNHCANMKVSVNKPNISEKNLLFRITLVDGSTQLIQIPEHQARSLGLQVHTITKSVDKVPVISGDVDPKLEPIDDIELSEMSDKTSHFVYKIVKPEDLNLKPIIKSNLPRGRPRKRPNQKTDSANAKPVDEPQKVVKQVRTRSGRITKPPKHIEKDFKKIDISGDSKSETDVKTSEFEPLTTNETPTEEPLKFLEQHCRKRNISSRFRCPTCNKAYLGRIRMMSHFHKHPDHGPSKYCKLNHNSTWNFLILTSQKYKEGPKGAKFCQELDALLQNARTLAQYLFKPVKDEKEGYFINDSLAHIFGISAGNYSIDETELNRDVTLYEYLENTESNNNANTDSACTISNKKDIIKEKDDDTNLKKCIPDKNVPNTFNSFEYMVNTNHTSTVSDCIRQTIKNSDNIIAIEKDSINLSDINFALGSQGNHSDIEFSIPNSSQDIITNKEQLKADTFINPQNSESVSHNNSNCLAVVKYQMQPKHGFIFNNHEYDNINNELDTVMDTNQLSNLTNYNNLEIKSKSIFCIENHKEATNTSQQISEKQNSHITLQNELHDVDDLILVNVDTGQVSNILDNSSNSDDIMNVDQFVNERFKKLTEQDMDIQNNLLNLELPPLDIFQFHTS